MTDYRDLIRSEFRNRKMLNPGYSLRDFAKQLCLSPSHLCEVLKKKKGISRKKARYFANSLKLSSPGTRCFEFMVSAQSGRSRAERNLGRNALKLHRFIPRAKKDIEISLAVGKNLFQIFFNNRFWPFDAATKHNNHRVQQILYPENHFGVTA